MIEKELDMLLIGKNYLSFLLGFELLERNRRILVLDDDRLSYGDLYIDSLPLLEISFLKTWGQDKEIFPLQNIEQYTKQNSLTFLVGDDQVRLGGRPSLNMIELARKIPSIMPQSLEIDWTLDTESGQKEFDEAFVAFAQRVAQNAFRYNSVQNFNTSAFLAHCPPAIKDCFDSFEKVFREVRSDSTGRASELIFFFMCRGKFQKKFSMELSRFELFHLFITILSPFYILDQENLLVDLEHVLIERGGFYKRTRVREWLFHKSKPWSIELASFEGIIHPSSISLLGADPSSMSIDLTNIGLSFGCIKLFFKSTQKKDMALAGEKYLRCDKSMLGTERPLWELEVFEDGVLASVYVKRLKGTKLEFHQAEIIKMLKSDFEKIIPGLWGTLEEPVMSWGPEIWIEGVGEKIKGDIPFPKSVQVTNINGPLKRERLNQVYYFGPYKEGPLGLLSSLMEIKDGQQFL